MGEKRKYDQKGSYCRTTDLFSAYEKFSKFLWSINVCRLHRPQIVYLCKQSIMRAFKRTQTEIKFDLLGYKRGGCRKLALHEQQNGRLKNEVSLVQCPFVILKNENSMPPSNMFFVHYYIASNLRYHSTTLFTRENQKGKKPKQQANIIELPMRPVYQYSSRQRYMPLTYFDRIQPQKSNRQMENEINELKGDLQMPHTLRRLDLPLERQKAKDRGPPQTNFDKWFNDYITITFARIRKTTKSMYSIYYRIWCTEENEKSRF